ncbi:MAG: N-acetylmuramic acid 6-phosphate etherase [Sporichthyaceae bacterium]|nr:N-acetylmuramic acid 6-phosphate etherase [Sporichthyaceae bacterium]
MSQAPTRPTDDAQAVNRWRLETRLTEAHRRDLADIDLLPTAELVRLMNAEDATVPAAVAAASSSIVAVIDATVERLRHGGRLVYVGAGTAGRLGVLDASEIPPTFNAPPDQVIGLLAGGPQALTDAVELAEDNLDAGRQAVAELDVGPHDVVVGVASSGTTPYVVAAVEHAAAVGAMTVALVCNRDTPLAEIADHEIATLVGPEFVTGSTRLKAGTAQKLVLNMLSTLAMVRLGRTFGNLMVDVRVTNAKLASRAVRIVSLAAQVDESIAQEALEAAGNEPKVAILSLLAGLGPQAAEELLAQCNGDLRTALRSVA